MARLNYYLLDPKSKKETPIFLSITDSGKRVKLKTKQKVKPRAWNKTAKSIRASFIEYSQVQEELDRIEAIIRAEILSIRDKFNGLPDQKELKRILEAKIFNTNQDPPGTKFWPYFKQYIEKLPNQTSYKTGKLMAASTVESYNQTYNILEKFEESTGCLISFQTLKNEIYDQLRFYMESELNFSLNTVGKHVKNLKAVINSAKDSGIIISQDYREKYWRVTQRTKSVEEIIFLNESELKELWELDLSENKTKDKVRDIFLIGAWTGLRISDILNLTSDNFDLERGLISVQVQKTGSIVSIPLHPIVLNIFNKYQGDPPKLSEPMVNREIKNVCSNIKSLKKSVRISSIEGERPKKYNLVTTHAARRSFASNMFKRDMRVHQIMAITGHKKENDFFRYIGVTNEEIAIAFTDKFKDWYK